MKDKRQNEELVTKSFFNKEIDPIKKDISDLKQEMSNLRQELISAMCEQTQKIIDHFEDMFKENKKEHFEMRRDIKACKNELGL